MGEIVYVLILNFNSSKDSVELFENLTGLFLQSLKILVIDNNSMETDINFLQENIPSKNLIFNDKNLGYAGGNNIGIEIALKANADYIWILNPDIRVESQTLPILLKTITADKTLAAIGPRIVHRNNPGKIFSDGEMLVMDKKCSTYHKNHNLEVALTPKSIDYNIDYIAGSSILLNCQAIREIGKFPEEYFLYFEETDWCFRAHKNKWKLAVNSHSEVYNLTSIKSAVFNYYFIRNKLIFCKKYHLNFRKVRNYYMKDLIKEVISRLKGGYFKPYFNSRLKGLFLGILKTSLYK